MLAKLVAIGLVGVALAVAAAVAGAVPDGPRLAVLTASGERAAPGLATLTLENGRYRRVLGPASLRGSGANDLGGLAWSPDGSVLAFSHRDSRGLVISVMLANGGLPQVVPGTRGGFLPVFSPDGQSLAFTRQRREKRPGRPSYDLYESTSVWMVDLASGRQNQLTRWRDDLDHYSSSFSPDGSTLLVTRMDIERSGDSELVALRLDGRPSGLLVGEGALPVYSPDGSTIALFRVHERSFKINGKGPPSEFGSNRRYEEDVELYVVNADGSHLRRLTHTPDKDELYASWDPSGKRIAYAQFRSDRYESPNLVMQINADGTCPTEILGRKGTIFFTPAWQPGPGREAGRISC